MKRFLLLSLLALCVLPARAVNPARVGSATPVSDSTGTSTTLTINYTPTASNTMLIFIGANVNTVTISSVKDNNGVTYPLRVSDTNSGKFSQIYGLTGVTAGITSFTVTWTAGPHIWMDVVEYSNAFLGQVAITDTAGTVTSASLSITTQANNNIFVGIFVIYGSATAITGTGTTTVIQTSSFSDVGVVADTSLATAGSVSNAISWTNAAAFSTAGIEMSSNPMNVVQFNGNNCSSAVTCAVTFAQPVQTVDYIIAAGYDGTSPTANDTFSDGTNSYTQVSIAGHVFCGLSTDGDTIAMSYAKAVSSAAFTVTQANGGTTGHKIPLIVEVNGLAASSPLDQVSGCANTTAVTSLTTSNVTTTSANEMALAVFGLAASATFTPGANYILLSQIPAGAGNGVFGNESRGLTATGSYNASMSISASQEMAGFLATFKGASQPTSAFGSLTFGSTKTFGGTLEW